MDSPSEVVGGYTAKYEDWPFLVELVDKRQIDVNNPKSVITNRTNALICGGSLISNEWVLTARHCFINTGIDKDNLVIVYFRNNFSNPSLALVTDIITYIDPNISAETDLALVKLKNKLGDDIKTVSLTKEFDYPTFTGNSVSINPTNVTIAGWGSIINGQTVIPSEPNETILVTVPPEFNNNIYAQDTINKSGACKGDSGGPLIAYQDGKRVLVGVTAEVINGCGGLASYVNVSKFISWINMPRSDMKTNIAVSQGSFIGTRPVLRKPTIVRDRWWSSE